MRSAIGVLVKLWRLRHLALANFLMARPQPPAGLEPEP